jgi:hypothetical protein
MKKMMMMVAVALMTAMSVNAQSENLKNELSLSYGFGSTSQLGSGIGEGLSLIFSDTEYNDGSILGPVSVEYFRHLNNPKLAVGGFVSYSKWDSDIQKKGGNHEKVGERNRNYIAVMPGIKYYWVNNNSFGLYSKAAVGAAFLKSTEKDLATNTSKDESSTHFMFQASFLGAEFGNQFRGFAEVGVGEQGFIQAGIRYKF